MAILQLIAATITDIYYYGYHTKLATFEYADPLTYTTRDMSDIEDIYQYTTIEDSIISKDWAAGSSKLAEFKEFVVTATGGTYTAVKYPPALWKVIDEPIVNALDHVVRSIPSAHHVTQIRVDLTAAGRVRVYNDGSGIACVRHSVASEKLNRDIYLPTLLFGIAFQGSNRVQAPDCIIGGTNGLGGKLSNCFSNDFLVETLDGERNLLFVQQWEHHKAVEHPPKICGVATAAARSLPAERQMPHVMLSFTPDYTGLFGYSSYDAALHSTLCDLVRTRMHFAAAYTAYTARESQTVPVYMWFNGEQIRSDGISSLAAKLFPTKKHMTTWIEPAAGAKASPYRYPWEVCCVVWPAHGIDANIISIVNGIVVRGGNHHKRIFTQICDYVENAVASELSARGVKFSPSFVSNNVIILLNTKIPRPGWTGQRKDVLDGVSIRKLTRYVLPAAFGKEVAAAVRTAVIDSIFSTPGKAPKAEAAPTYEKYQDATFASHTTRRKKCAILAVEGDSPMRQIQNAISKTIGWDYYGVISLGGVIMNARRQCEIVETPGGQLIAKSTALERNLFMNALSSVIGLNTAYKYDPMSPTYAKEINKLRYGAGIVACVDQDLDGKGNILGLLLNVFDLFWPKLLAAGFVRWFNTPIVRAYPKAGGKVLSFHSIPEFNKWSTSEAASKYASRYFKGIGGHSPAEAVAMFRDFTTHLITFGTDDRTHDVFETYFGADASLRKRELALPTAELSEDLLAQQLRTHIILCSDQLELETNLYQKDNLERKLDHIVDGQNQAGRKVLNGILKLLRGHKILKVAQISGPVSASESYEHGEDGLCKTITGKAFVAVGGKQLPFLVPLSFFGSHQGGGKDAASPRYIWTQLNERLTSLLFPAADYPLLPFNFNEGHRCEPQYFVPIIPLAICEFAQLPAHGWKLETWARCVFSVIDNVLRWIRIGEHVPVMHMPPATCPGSPYEWRGHFGTIRGQLYSFGTYRIESADTLVITGLPLRVWIVSYIEHLTVRTAGDGIIDPKRPLENLSDDMNVRIVVHLLPGALTKLDTLGDSVFTDGIEEYFRLRHRMADFLNYMGTAREVITCTTYEEVFRLWYPIRAEYYSRRYDRETTLADLRIIHRENVLSYVTADMRLSGIPAAEQVIALTAAGYVRLNTALLEKPKFTPSAELRALITAGDGASYDYLLRISDYKKSAEKISGYKDALAAARANLAALHAEYGAGRFVGATVWERDLLALADVIREGFKTAWRFGDATKYEL